MSSASTFPQNYFSTEVEAPGDEVAEGPRGSPDSHQTDQTASVEQGQDPSLNPPSSQTQGQINFDRPKEREGQPSVKPSLMDRIIGKIEKTAGEQWNIPYLAEKGQLRRTGILAARRAPNP